MEFIIERTSAWGDEKPCDEAYRKAYTREDVRTVDDPSKLNSSDRENWYTIGVNHRVEKYDDVNNYIVRDFPDEAWFITIDTLDQLLDFHSKYGHLVIGTAWSNRQITKIEIYDDYRE